MIIQHEEGPMRRLLPDDVLEDVLRRVAPRGVATSRRVCRAWRALIDDRRLLRRELLPRSLAGFLVNYNELTSAELFHRPSADFTGYAMPYVRVGGHCNGVLLLYHGLLNPATRWWAPFPESPPPPFMGMERFIQEKHLVFDPAASPSHCEVFLIPRVPRRLYADHPSVESAATLGSEWPPSPCVLNVFSTVTGRWTERSFSREGEAAGTVADMQMDQRWLDWRHSVYWRGALYVHCEKDFVMRLSLSDDTYRMIRPPRGLEMCEFLPVHLGKSEKGVYYALIDDNGHLQIWILDESRSQTEWVLKHGSGCQQPSLSYFGQQGNGPWILDNANRQEGDSIEAPVELGSEWNSDDEDVLNTEDGDENPDFGYFDILGLHPYKEIVFLGRSLHRGSRGLAYHLNTSKLEDLGNTYPIDYFNKAIHPFMKECFPYTPCTMGPLPVDSTPSVSIYRHFKIHG